MALLYFIPVAIAAVRLSKLMTTAVSILAAITWFMADYFVSSSPMRNYPHESLVWIGAIRLGTLSIVSYLVVKVNEAIRAREESAEKLRLLNQELQRRVDERTADLRKSLDEMEHFSYSITHDMRAPRRAMISFAQLAELESCNCQPPVDQTFIRHIKMASTRMDKLITDALSFSKAIREELPLGPVNLANFLRDLIETYPNLRPDKADIQIEGVLPTVLGNEAGLTQCFGNLLDNAVKFAKPSTKAKVRVWATSVQPSPATIPAADRPGLTDGHTMMRRSRSVAPQSPINPRPSTGDSVRIWVADDGIGIPKIFLNQIFGMFQRGTNVQEGTGIGLAIVRKVVERMGGQVGVESREGIGSRFWVDLLSAPRRDISVEAPEANIDRSSFGADRHPW